MKKVLLSFIALAFSFMANARVDIDFSSRFEEGTNTIHCLSAWGWNNVIINQLEIEDCDYLYIEYESSCNFNLILQDQDWQTNYQQTCLATATEGLIRLEAGKKTFSCVVVQNHAEGDITIKNIYFCTEHEYLYPDPQEMEAARANLVFIYWRYLNLSDGILPGDDYGQYSQELFDAFQAALEGALILDEPSKNYGYDLSVDEINALSHAIVDTYLALLASKKLYLPADGYYRFICARQFANTDDDSNVTTYTKAMYSKPTGENGWKNVEATDATFLWQLERQEDNTYLLTNPANGMIFSTPENCGSTQAFIAIDPINKVDGAYQTVWPLSTEEEMVMFNFRMSTEKANDYKYVHMNWHNQGEGWEGPLTVWCSTTNDSGASEWYLEPVDAEEASALLDDKAFVRNFFSMLEDAKQKVDIANDMTKVKLITEAEQFSSPFSQNDLGNRDGGSLSEGVLLDNDTNSFWHSYWEGGNAEAGVHYLQVELPEEVGGRILMDIARRKTSSDHVTQWGIYGSNEPFGDKFDYEWIADVDMPYSTSGERRTAIFDIEDGKSYQYLRFYAEQTNSNRGYWHVSEFQLFNLLPNPNNQAAQLGELYTQLLAAIEKAEAVDANAVTFEDYEALKAAYEPFVARFVDPTPLREAIEAAEPALELAEIGTNPGQWTQETVNAWTTKLADARAYDKSGRYTQEQSDSYLADLADPGQRFLAAANTVSADKYYTIRFASEEKYEQRSWSTSNVEDSDFGALYDTYLCPAEETDLTSLAATDLRQGSYVFFTDDDEADIAFRFIPIDHTDDVTTYIIQHVASGLFIHCYGRNSWTGLTLTPTLFTVQAVGYGENIIRGVDYDGKDMACLHAQLSDHRLVTWQDDYVGCNSGLIIEEVQAETAVGSPLADYKAGELTTMCYPVSVGVSEGQLFSVEGTYSTDDKLYVALTRLRSAAAGQPVVYLADGTYNEDAEDDLRTITLTVGTTVQTAPLNDGALQGTYESLDLTEEALIFRAGKCEFSSEETATVGPNHAYLPAQAVTADPAGTYDLVIEVGGDLSAVGSVLATLSQRGNVYDAAGHLVRSNATLSDVQSLPRGLYLLHGTKILVK